MSVFFCTAEARELEYDCCLKPQNLKKKDKIVPGPYSYSLESTALGALVYGWGCGSCVLCMTYMVVSGS